MSEYLSRSLNRTKPLLGTLSTYLLLVLFFSLRTVDEYTRFGSLDPQVLLREKGVLAYAMNYLSNSSGIPELGFAILFLFFVIALIAFFCVVPKSEKDKSALFAAFLCLSPIILSPNNYRQNLAIIIISIVYWLYSTRELIKLPALFSVVLISIFIHFSAAIAIFPLLFHRVNFIFRLSVISAVILSIFSSFIVEGMPFEARKFLMFLEPTFIPTLIVDEIFDVTICLILVLISAKKYFFLEVVWYGLLIEIAFHIFPDFSSRIGAVLEFAETFLLYIFLRDYDEKKHSIGKYLVFLLLGESIFKLFL